MIVSIVCCEFLEGIRSLDRYVRLVLICCEKSEVMWDEDMKVTVTRGSVVVVWRLR